MSIKNGEIKGVKTTPRVGLDNKNPLYTETWTGISPNNEEMVFFFPNTLLILQIVALHPGLHCLLITCYDKTNFWDLNTSK